MAITLSLLCCRHLLCPRCSIAWYWEQSAFPFKALSCHPSAIARFHPFKLPYNGNHAVRTKGRAEGEKEGSCTGKAAAAAAAAAGLTLFSWVSTWTCTGNIRALHLLLPLLAQLICPGQALEGSLAASAPRPAGTSGAFPAPAASPYPPPAAGEREGCGAGGGKASPGRGLIASSTSQNTNPACWASFISLAPPAIYPSEQKSGLLHPKMQLQYQGLANCLESL